MRQDIDRARRSTGWVRFQKQPETHGLSIVSREVVYISQQLLRKQFSRQTSAKSGPLFGQQAEAVNVLRRPAF